MPHTTDLDLTTKDVAELTSPDAITALLTKLAYDTADRTALSPEAVGLAGESASAIKKIELLSETFERLKANADATPHLRASQDSRSYAQAATFTGRLELAHRYAG